MLYDIPEMTAVRRCVGFAALTMNRDIGLTPYEFGWGAGLLFPTYSIFEIPSNLILYRLGARRWIARIMITWGLVAVANAFVVGPASFYIVRLLLGGILSRHHLLPRQLVPEPLPSASKGPGY